MTGTFQNSELEDPRVGEDNEIMGTSSGEVLTGTSENDTIYGGRGRDTIYGDSEQQLTTIGDIEEFESTSGGNGFTTTEAAYLGDWYAPVGHSVLLETDFGLSDSGRGNVLELASDQNASIERTFNEMRAGSTYTLSFEMAMPTYQRFLGVDGVEVTWNGIVMGSYTADSYLTWQTINVELVEGIGDGSNELVLEGVGASDYWGAVIDNVSLSSIEVFAGNDWLSGGNGKDTLYGMGGTDWLDGGRGADYLDGGEGNDRATYLSATSGVVANLDTGRGTLGDARNDTYVDIENLHGSNFDDVLTGDDNQNRLVGHDGDDELYGLDGTDYLLGGEGADLLDGGLGNDTAEYDYSEQGVTVSLTTGTGEGGTAEGDTLTGIENLVGSYQDDELTGDGEVNRLNGLDGDDALFGMSGNDTLVGSLGADALDGGEGIDTANYAKATSGVSVNLTTGGYGGEATGDTFNDVEAVYGSLYDDIIEGDDSVNRLNGHIGNDALIGGGGNDYLVGGQGADALFGGEGTDTADYSKASKAVTVSLATGGTQGEADGDTFDSVEAVYSTVYDDVLIGDDGVNRLNGNDGNDILNGAGGRDYLIGGVGDDILTGGEGLDYFLYKMAFGNDTITDFVGGEGRVDRIWLDNLGVENFNDLNISDSTNGAVIDLGGFGTITLAGVDSTTLVAEDFLF